ncbi:MAG TPA: bifunctional hydroxymethylpyrimidine kinase/phosphomethylpyrimidine kinase [Candidatus Binataceae bacterium]|nr:bifunctional hydroxymethylpyrimidine kinase/phosphomethylpyrimidine kinase [Candidatus Binataceae bacterium]
MPSRTGPPIALTIAGSDPGGGAGIQADLKVFAALGVYGFSALTAVIAQNSSSVERVQAVAPAMVAAQIESVAAERMPHAVKTGALASAGVVRAVARAISDLRLPAPVVDPVIVSSAGVRLLDRAGERAMHRYLLPIARVITPNIAEAEALTRLQIDSDAAIRAAARAIIAMGARAVVITGGHWRKRGDAGHAIDLFHDGHAFVELRAARVAGGGAHGTGCAFSAAIAASLARGMELEAAVRAAKRYVTAALRRRFRLGAGRALLGHLPPR